MEPLMKKPKLELEEQTPRKIVRADKAPTDGYWLVVDGHFKSHHATVEAAEEAGMALKINSRCFGAGVRRRDQDAFDDRLADAGITLPA